MTNAAAADLAAAVVVRLRPAASRIALFDPDEPPPGLAPATLVAVQPWRPACDRLEAEGIRVVPTPDGSLRDMDCAIVMLGRQRVRSLATIGQALTACRADGLVVVAGSNELGPASYARRLRTLGTSSGGHARAFWARARDAVDAPTRDSWIDAARIRPAGADGHHAAPGIFAWDRVDEGSALLAARLPVDLGVVVADLGAGWGYLAGHVLAHGRPRPRRLDLYEADWHALAAARLNLAHAPPDTAIDFLWHDAARGVPRRDYDTVVMNPPFHDTRGADPSIGLAFIAAARDALRRGGRLWIVANRTLPYEAALRDGFTHAVTHEAGPRYKIIEAVR
ncbi:MAG: class I SAM-dependent methyltransferase [Alphaproteobacteria bacterium]|nr:class I SAM-dependent methyltransferase [Alphaproteobacteria bacterium]